MSYFSHYGIFLGKTMIRDIGFDTADFRYTTQNIWLRKRNCSGFELKRAVKRQDQQIDCYEEVSDPDQILQILGIADTGDFADSLEKASIVPFVSFVTHREKYRLPGFTIDIDSADFGDFSYQVAEVECLVEEEQEVAEAERRINQFLRQFPIDLSKKPLAKISAFLQIKRPEHYKALQSAAMI
jgi:adenylate cyclase class IV